MKHIDFKPQGVCSMKIEFDVDDDNKLHNVAFMGGCNGNLKAIGRLVEGKDASRPSSVITGR